VDCGKGPSSTWLSEKWIAAKALAPLGLTNMNQFSLDRISYLWHRQISGPTPDHAIRISFNSHHLGHNTLYEFVSLVEYRIASDQHISLANA